MRSFLPAKYAAVSYYTLKVKTQGIVKKIMISVSLDQIFHGQQLIFSENGGVEVDLIVNDIDVYDAMYVQTTRSLLDSDAKASFTILKDVLDQSLDETYFARCPKFSSYIIKLHVNYWDDNPAESILKNQTDVPPPHILKENMLTLHSVPRCRLCDQVHL